MSTAHSAQTTPTDRADPITLQIVRGALRAVQSEMEAVIVVLGRPL